MSLRPQELWPPERMQEYFYDLVSGGKTGSTATMLRGGLRILESPYCAAVSLRNFLYNQKILASRRFPIPIISVGNLTLGGTGKSPMTAWLCKLFLEQNRKPGLVSRGYASANNHGPNNHGPNNYGNDEFREMMLRFPNVPHIQNPNRAEAIRQLLQAGEADVIILDDAFQHRQVARDIDMVLLDATSPFGFGHVFPRGTLREPVGELCRANIVLLTRSDLVSGQVREKIKQQVLAINPKIIWGETVHEPTSLYAMDGVPGGYRTEPIESVHGQPALAFCGIGNPEAFRKTLERCGVRIKKLIPFPDHHWYTPRDIDELLRTAKAFDTDLILCTMKDLVKLTPLQFSDVRLRAVLIEIRFLQESEQAVRAATKRAGG